MRRRDRNGFKNRRHASHRGPMHLLMVGWMDVYQHHSAGGWGMGHTMLHKACLQNPHAGFFFFFRSVPSFLQRHGWHHPNGGAHKA